MRKLFIMVAICAGHFIYAQDETESEDEPRTKEVSFDNLEVPNTPAFMLLDEAPTSVQRPNSTRAFAFDLLQDATGGGAFGNIAVEVTPFWMIQHTNMTPEKFYGIQTSKDGGSKQNWFSKLRLASISAAYMNSADAITNISLGIRTTVIEIKRPKDIKDYKASLKEAQIYLNNSADYAEEFTKICKVPKPENFSSSENYQAAKKEYDATCSARPVTPPFGSSEEAITAYDNALKKYSLDCLCDVPLREHYDSQQEFAAAMTWYETSLNAYRAERRKEDGFNFDEFDLKFQEIINRKPILAMDMAVAYNQRFYGNSFNDNGTGRFGVWTTLAFSTFIDSKPIHTDNLNVYGYARYLDDTFRGVVLGAEEERFSAFDIGIKGELEFQKLSIGYEYINRSGDMEGYRSVGTIRYQIINGIFITGSFGNNFDEMDDLVTLFGIKWGMNNPLQNILLTQND